MNNLTELNVTGLVISRREVNDDIYVKILLNRGNGVKVFKLKSGRKLTSRLQLNLDLLNKVKINFIVSGDTCIITRVTCISMYKNIKLDPMIVMVLADLLDKVLHDGMEDEDKLLANLLFILDFWERKPAHKYYISIKFLMQIIRFTGISPDPSFCPICRKQIEEGSSEILFNKNGIIHKDCSINDSRSVDGNIYTYMSSTKIWPRKKESVVKPLFPILFEYVGTHFGLNSIANVERYIDYTGI